MVFPNNEVLFRRLASLPRVRSGCVPRVLRYYQGAPTSCQPSRRASLPSLGDTASAFGSVRVSLRRRTPSEGPGVGNPVAPTGRPSAEMAGAPKFLGNPNSRLPMFSDPGRPERPRPLRDIRVAPARGTDEGADDNRLSRLNRMAFGLAVYASRWRSPAIRARLASRCWSGSPGRA